MKQQIVCLIGFLFLTTPEAVQAQFRYRTNNNAIVIIGYTGTSGVVTVPDTINGFPVVSIGDNAFQNAYVLTNVTISSGVTNLGNFSFYNCTNLGAVTLPDPSGTSASTLSTSAEAWGASIFPWAWPSLRTTRSIFVPVSQT